MNWDNIKITPKDVKEFLNEIDMDALMKNIDVILDKQSKVKNLNEIKSKK